MWQAEIDAPVETIDFWRFNAKYGTTITFYYHLSYITSNQGPSAEELYNIQPPENSFGVWNRMEFRALEGFVAAITPFNFLGISRSKEFK